MNRVNQTYKTYEPRMVDHYIASYYGYGNERLASFNTGCEKTTELIGIYKAYKEYRGHLLDDERAVLIMANVLSEEEKLFDFESSFDVPIGSKIEINGQEHTIKNKKYHLNGDIDYFIEDKYIKSTDYEDKYEIVKKQAENHLLNQRELENEYEKKKSEEDIEEKKSIWWYFGIR